MKLKCARLVCLVFFVCSLVCVASSCGSGYTTSAINAVQQTSYQDGYSAGYDAGKQAGYNAGHDAGYNKGYDEGYAKGKAEADPPPVTPPDPSPPMDDYVKDYVVNTNTGKFHNPDCSSVDEMYEHNKKFVTTTRDQLIADGYSPCGRCHP